MSDTGRTNGDDSREIHGGKGRVVAVLVLVLAAAAATTYVLTRPPADRHAAATRPTTTATTTPSTQPQTAPTTRVAKSGAPAKPRGPATQYSDVIQANYPRMSDI